MDADEKNDDSRLHILYTTLLEHTEILGCDLRSFTGEDLARINQHMRLEMYTAFLRGCESLRNYYGGVYHLRTDTASDDDIDPRAGGGGGSVRV